MHGIAEVLTMAKRNGLWRLAAAVLAVLVATTVYAAAGRETVMVPMGDGVRLATDVYLPPGDGPWPVVLTRTPYGRGQAGLGGLVATSMGYAGVSQDMRGRFDSEGENLPFIGCGWVDHQDGADTLAWILKQPWCNGKIGTIGASAGGITQNLMAGAAPKGLAAQYLIVAAANLYADAAYVGGALRKEQVENWTREHKFDPKAMDVWRGHPALDAYWERFDSTRKFAVMTAPAVHVGGWFDIFCQGTIDAFVGRQHAGAAGARGRQKLIMGPWTHGGMDRTTQGELAFPRSKPPWRYDPVRWFDCLLKGEANGVLEEPAVAYFAMGDVEDPEAPGNVWRYVDDWPVPCTETAYGFRKGGGLAAGAPSDADAVEEYTADPADPCPTLGGGNLTIPAGPMNQNRIEGRLDVLKFTTEPLAEPLEVTGRVLAKVWVSSSAADTDLSVRLCDVYPDGRSFLMAEGMRRLRYRDSFAEPKPLEPGKACEVTVDCWSTSIVFNRGHRVRVTVTSSNYPRFDVNPGTGEPWAEGCRAVKQTNRIFCEAKRPSRILLPVVAAAPK
jgi:predicted acyl esterase